MLTAVFLVYKLYFEETREVTENTNLPDFALKDETTRLAYMAAVERQEEFGYIACYCGCGMHSMVHRGKTIPQMYSLKECFIRSNGEWEEHAALDCSACIYTALEADALLDRGMSLKEVRAYIDEKYGGGQTHLGTRTPMPQ